MQSISRYKKNHFTRYVFRLHTKQLLRLKYIMYNNIDPLITLKIESAIRNPISAIKENFQII